MTEPKKPRKRAAKKAAVEPEPVVEEVIEEPEPEEEEPVHINAPFAFVQAAQSLQLAEQWAIDSHDHESLVASATVWVEMGQHLLANGVDLVYDESAGTVAQEEVKDEPFTIGFAGGNDDTKPTEEPNGDQLPSDG